MLSRTIPGEVLTQYSSIVKSMQNELQEYFRQEKLKANIDELEMEAQKAENLLVHENEIQARPARTWYQTERQKMEQRETSREGVKAEQSVAQLGVEKAKITAVERARALALADDYPLDKDTNKVCTNVQNTFVLFVLFYPNLIKGCMIIFSL